MEGKPRKLKPMLVEDVFRIGNQIQRGQVAQSERQARVRCVEMIAMSDEFMRNTRRMVGGWSDAGRTRGEMTRSMAGVW